MVASVDRQKIMLRWAYTLGNIDLVIFDTPNAIALRLFTRLGSSTAISLRIYIYAHGKFNNSYKIDLVVAFCVPLYVFLRNNR